MTTSEKAPLMLPKEMEAVSDLLPVHTAVSWNAKILQRSEAPEIALAVTDSVFVPWVHRSDEGVEYRHAAFVAERVCVDSPVAKQLTSGDFLVMGTDPSVSGISDDANVTWVVKMRAAYNNSEGWWMVLYQPQLDVAHSSRSWSREECLDALAAAVSVFVQKALDARAMEWDLWSFRDRVVFDRLVSVAVVVDDEGCPERLTWTMESGQVHESQRDCEITESDNGSFAWNSEPVSWVPVPLYALGEESEPASLMLEGKEKIVSFSSTEDGGVAYGPDGERFDVPLGSWFSMV